MRSPAPAIFALGVALGAAGAGCALVLGFEDTALQTEGDEAGLEAGTEGGVVVDARAESGTSALSVDPSSIVVRRGGTADATVTLARADGATGPVRITVAGLPQGVTAAPAEIAGGKTSAVVSVTAAAAAKLGSSTITLSVDVGGVAPIEATLLVSDEPGATDEAFGAAGAVLETSRGSDAAFKAIAVQADGAIVAGGAGGALSPGWLVRRVDATGKADAAFTVALTGLPSNGEVRGIAIDPGTSKIVLVGTSAPTAIGPKQLTVIRRLPTGAPDPTFAGGVFRLALPDAALGSEGLGVAVAADGSVVAVGSRGEVNNDQTGLVVRLTSAGALAPAFNAGKLLALAKTPLVGVAFDGDGLVVGGVDMTTATRAYFVSRRLSDGKPDPAFGTAGASTFGMGFQARAFARASDGSLLLAGTSSTGGSYTVGRTDDKGATVFVRVVASLAGASFFGLAADANGRLVAAGHAGNEARVERVGANGVIDDTFGTGGAAQVDATALYASAVQPDGRLLVAGGRTGAGAILVRLWP